MPVENPNVDPTTGQPSGVTQPSGVGTDPQASGLTSPDQPRGADGRFQPSEWRYPADYSVTWLRGRTADEAATLSNEMYQSVLGQAPAPQVASAPALEVPPDRVPPATGQPVVPQQPTADDWLNDPASASARQLEHVRATQFDPVIQQQQDALAQLARGQSVQRFADEFSRWGPEIDTMARQVPANQRTPQAYEWIVDMVRGRHATEVQNEEIERRIQERMTAGEIIRPDASGASGASPTTLPGLDLESTELPEWWRNACQGVGIKPRDVDKFLMDTKFYGSDLERARTKYIEAVKRDGVVATDGVKT